MRHTASRIVILNEPLSSARVDKSKESGLGVQKFALIERHSVSLFLS